MRTLFFIIIDCSTAQLRNCFFRIFILIQSTQHFLLYIAVFSNFYRADFCTLSLYLLVHFKKEIIPLFLRRHWLAHFYYPKRK